METITHALRQIRKTLDGTQPIDTTGAVMGIDYLLKIMTQKQNPDYANASTDIAPPDSKDAPSSRESERVIELLMAGGFVTAEKVAEARELARSAA